MQATVTFVLYGTNTKIPHTVPSNQVIQPGDKYIIDSQYYIVENVQLHFVTNNCSIRVSLNKL